VTYRERESECAAGFPDALQMGKSEQQQNLRGQQSLHETETNNGFLSGLFCSVALKRVANKFSFKCFFILLLTFSVFVSGIFWILPFHSMNTGFDAKDEIKISGMYVFSSILLLLYFFIIFILFYFFLAIGYVVFLLLLIVSLGFSDASSKWVFGTFDYRCVIRVFTFFFFFFFLEQMNIWYFTLPNGFVLLVVYLVICVPNVFS
jgi:hypothetical protein